MRMWMWGGGWYIYSQVGTRRIMACSKGVTVDVGDAPMVMRAGMSREVVDVLVIG